MGRILPLIAVALALAAAAVVANLVLLGYAGYGNDRIGTLKPVAPGIVPARVVPPAAPPATTTAPRTTTVRAHHGGEADD